MKVYIDDSKLRLKMAEARIRTYKKLCEEAGITNPSKLASTLTRHKSSLNTAFLLADCLGCRIEDIISVDWEV